MIAYNRESLDNLDIQVQAMEAFDKKLLPAEEYDRIRAAHPYHFYLPNFFVRIGLFILTMIAAACGLGLLLLMGVGSGGFGTIAVIYAALAYGALELFIHGQKMYGSGVDDALLWLASICFLSGIAAADDFDLHPATLSLITLLVAFICVLRYADRLMTLVAYGALLCLVFYTAAALGPIARAILPFLIMALSIGFYLLFTSLENKHSLRHYRSCILLLRVASLLSLYAAGNYFVVREANEYISHHPGPIALGWLWWLFTILIPIFYIVKGIQKKDALFLWTGMALVTATVFTVRYYYHIMPMESIMIIAGSLLIAGVYAVHRYLRTPKHGFTSAQPDYKHPLTDLPAEAIILAETFKNTPTTTTGVQFGGGTTGGGGAGGQY
ncbi:MAG: hypothetical protein JST68_09730 [Bacteroidetes bacterium]|nr:hypothetical protein [Bacteroidota bacterium]